MSSTEGDFDKSEAPTAHKLDRARDRGAFTRSQDTTYVVLLAAATAAAFALGLRTLAALADLLRYGLSAAVSRSPTNSFTPYFIAEVSEAAVLVAPLIFVFALAALIGSAVQARGVFTAETIKPDFSKLNPANGLKRLFSLRSLLELARTLLKLCFSAALLWFWGRQHLHDVLRVSSQNPGQIVAGALALVAQLMLCFTIIYIALAAIDWLIARWDFMKQMRMSKREVKDEFKEREGDPRIKQRLRELRVELLRRARSLARVPAASVVVTNPTHIAVCIEYDERRDPAPRVSARGQGLQASLIRTLANRHGVAIVENPPLARGLFRSTADGDFIGPEHYGPVAKILLWIAAVRRPAKAKAA